MNNLFILCGQSKVETQNLASHKQRCAIMQGEYMAVVAAVFLGRRKILRLYRADAIIALI